MVVKNVLTDGKGATSVCTAFIFIYILKKSYYTWVWFKQQFFLPLSSKNRNILEYIKKFQPPVDWYAKISSSVQSIIGSCITIQGVMCNEKLIPSKHESLCSKCLRSWASKCSKEKRCEQSGSHNGEALPISSLKSKMPANLPKIHFHPRKWKYECRLNESTEVVSTLWCDIWEHIG